VRCCEFFEKLRMKGARNRRLTTEAFLRIRALGNEGEGLGCAIQEQFPLYVAVASQPHAGLF
jgi:hypothetical protein